MAHSANKGHRSPLHQHAGHTLQIGALRDREVQMITKSPLNIVAAAGLAFGAVFGMAGTFVSQPNLQALLWGIDAVGLVMATSLLALKYFRSGNDFVDGGFLVLPSVEKRSAILAKGMVGEASLI